MKTELDYIELKKVKKVNLIKEAKLPDKYVADDQGNVYIHNKTLPKKTIDGKLHIVVKKMKPYKTKLGYMEYVLTNKNGIKKHLQVHRIVATLFIPNKKKLPHVNHKDGDRSNNTVTNLEWSSISDNIKHSYKYLRGKKK